MQGDTPPVQPGDGIISRCLAFIEAKPISWLWDGRIARGKLTVIAGNPGGGKSTLTAWLAATISTGGCLPLGALRCVLGSVIFLSAEDDPADTLRPRLEAVGADLNRIHFIDAVAVGYRADGTPGQRGFSLQADIEALGRLIEKLGDVVAVVVDPITAYLGDVDSHKNADVRALLVPLSEMAARYGVAVIAVSHLSKAQGQQALMRVTGSLAFVAAARAAFLVAADPEDKARRLFLPLKNNIGPDETGLAFRIEGATVPSGKGPIQTSRIVWESEAVTMTADEAMDQATDRDEVHSALGGAKAFLSELLAEGAMNAKRVRREANDAGHSWASVRRAQKALGVVTTKRGMDEGWDWSLPKVLKTPEDAQTDIVSNFGEVEHLRSGDGVAEVEL
jgi:KaiC/GvpD/RAD55 family RecA-like ATPase